MLKKIGLATALLAGLMTSAYADTVKVGLQPWLGYGPLWVAKEKGFFEKNGVDVELINFTWDQDMTAAQASDNVNVMAGATNLLITNFNQGVDQKGFLIMDVSFEADAIMAGKDVASVKDLKGKKVAFETGATSDLLINYALKENGLTIADVEHIPMGAADAGLALISGRVDAAVTYEPYISTALKQGQDYKVLYTSAEKPGLISDMLIASSTWIKEHPEEVKGLIRAWDDAIKFIRENPEEGQQMIAKAVGSPMEEFIPAFKGVRLYTLEENIKALEGEFQDTAKQIAEILQATNPKDIKTIPTADDIMILDPIREVAKQ